MRFWLGSCVDLSVSNDLLPTILCSHGLTFGPIGRLAFGPNGCLTFRPINRLTVCLHLARCDPCAGERGTPLRHIPPSGSLRFPSFK
jgi:hypothetical protein